MLCDGKDAIYAEENLLSRYPLPGSQKKFRP